MTKVSSIEKDIPIMVSERSRIEMTVSCKDADQIPKVDRAGTVVLENGTSLQIMHNGIRVLAGGYYGDWMTEIIRRLRGHHEPQEEAVFDAVLRHVPRDGSILEFGGHWSYYSLWFMHGFPNTRRAFVIEPDPNHLSIGQRNAEINGYGLSFTQGFVGPHSQAAVPFQTESAGRLLLPMISIPEFLSSHGIDVLDILHCDSQGAELVALESCEALLRAGKIRFAVVSTHSHFITGDPLTHQRCLHLIREYGGQVLAEHDVHESFSGDGLIAAYFGSDSLEWSGVALTYNRYSKSLFRNPLFDLSLAQEKGNG
jgi:hypothetical protein